MAAGRLGRNVRRHGVCARCGKFRYETRADARRASRVLHPGEKLHAYRCGDSYHFGHDELWRELTPDDLIWKPMSSTALAQVLAMARATFIANRGAA